MVIPSTMCPMLDKIEGYRLSLRQRAWRWTIGILLIGAATTGCVLTVGALLEAAAAAVVSLALVFCVWQFYRNKVRASFRAAVIPELVRSVDPSLRYRGESFISEKEFADSGIWGSPDRYSGRDLVEGNVGDTHIRFSIVHAEEEYTETDTDSNGRTTTHTRHRTLFCGLFFSADCNKAFSSRTAVHPRAAGLLGRLSRRHVAIEDPQFTQNFSGSADDQVEARYLLTPALIDRLMALRGRLGEFHLVFVGNRVCLTVARSFNLFDPDIGLPMTHPSQIQAVFSALKSMTDIVTALNLNTRIWTKRGAHAVTANA